MMRCLFLLIPALVLSVGVIAQSKPAYQHEKQPCTFDGKLTSRSFKLAGKPYTVRYGVFCAGPYISADTVRTQAYDSYATDSVVVLNPPIIYDVQEQRVRIQLVSNAASREVIVKKSMFDRRFAGQKEWSKLGFGDTTLERIDERKRLLLFSTFVGYPFSDNGWLLKYAVDMNGVVSYTGLEDALFGP